MPNLPKKVNSLVIYYLDPYLQENGYILKKSKISLLQKISSHKVCVDCHKKLLTLEKIYMSVLKNKCRLYAELSNLRLECSDKIECYWS